VRAKIAAAPESSDSTSAQDRIVDLKTAEDVTACEEAPSSGLSASVGNSTCRHSEDGSPGAGEKGQREDVRDNRIEHGERAGWLAPIPLEPKRLAVRTKTRSQAAIMSTMTLTS
jgi:hypothetical protein